MPEPWDKHKDTKVVGKKSLLYWYINKPKLRYRIVWANYINGKTEPTEVQDKIHLWSVLKKHNGNQ